VTGLRSQFEEFDSPTGVHKGNIMKIGDKVKDTTATTFKDWVGVVEEDYDHAVLVKWDETYTLGKGLRYLKSHLEVVDTNTPTGNQKK